MSVIERILVTGAGGQIGNKLIPALAKFTNKQIWASDLSDLKVPDSVTTLKLDITKKDDYLAVVKEIQPKTIIHLAALLSATAEKNLEKAYQVNVLGVSNAFDVALATKAKIFIPSTIAAFGPNIPRENTPDDVILQPSTVYGVAKVYTELMGNYFNKNYNLDFRSLRYPGAVSSDPPGGGTTDYAVEIFFELIKNKTYECFLSKNTMLPMMYIDDLIRGTVDFIDAPAGCLNRRVYNLAAFSFTPEMLFKEIRKHIPDASIVYKPDHRQVYADSWPMSIDDTCARKDWGWKHDYNLAQMTEKMIELVSLRMGIEL